MRDRRPIVRAAVRGAAVLALASGCVLHRAPPPPPAVPEPPKPAVEFTPVPEAEAALVKNPHVGGKALCQRCHERGAPGVKKDAIALCADCHDAARMRHAFRVEAPARAIGKVPLLPGNLVACHTCHDPHDTKARRGGLRMSYRQLCVTCHEEHGPGDAPK